MNATSLACTPPSTSAAAPHVTPPALCGDAVVQCLPLAAEPVELIQAHGGHLSGKEREAIASIGQPSGRGGERAGRRLNRLGLVKQKCLSRLSGPAGVGGRGGDQGRLGCSEGGWRGCPHNDTCPLSSEHNHRSGITVLNIVLNIEDPINAHPSHHTHGHLGG